MNIDSKSVEIERAQRTGEWKPNSDKVRPIVVRFLRFKDKEVVLSKARTQIKIYVNDYFSDLLRRKRAEFILAMKEARERGNYAVISDVYHTATIL